jgi:mannose-6-phosphate isomerase-like protein (cupin superfamily)
MPDSTYKVCRVADAHVSSFESPKRRAFVFFTSEDEVSLGAGMCEMPPGSSNENHVHEDADEVMQIITGTFRFVFPDSQVELGPLDCIFVPRGTWHQIFNVGVTTGIHTFCFTGTAATDRVKNKYQ